MCAHMYTFLYVNIYVYRERDMCVCVYTYTQIHPCFWDKNGNFWLLWRSRLLPQAALTSGETALLTTSAPPFAPMKSGIQPSTAEL